MPSKSSQEHRVMCKGEIEMSYLDDLFIFLRYSNSIYQVFLSTFLNKIRKNQGGR
jgi:hypothetical protein